MVRVSGCGPEGRRFEPGYPPQTAAALRRKTPEAAKRTFAASGVLPVSRRGRLLFRVSRRTARGFFHPWLFSEVRLSRLSGRLRGRDGSLVRRVSANRFGNGRTDPTAEGIKQTSALNKYRGVAQLVARLLWEQDAAGSNPVTPTISSVHKRFHFMNTRFSFFDTVLCWSRFLSLLFIHAVNAFETYSTATPLRVSAL